MLCCVVLTVAFISPPRLQIILATAPFIAFGTAYESRIHRGFEDKTKKAYEESGEIAAEAIKEIRTVASLTREGHFEDRFAANIAHPHKLAQHKAYFASLGYGATQGFTQFANAVGFYAGLRLLSNNQIEFQNMFTVIMVCASSRALASLKLFCFLPLRLNCACLIVCVFT